MGRGSQSRLDPPATNGTSTTPKGARHTACTLGIDRGRPDGKRRAGRSETAEKAVNSRVASSCKPRTRSVTQNVGLEESTAMRSVALDLGVRETSFCEVSQGVVVARRTVRDLDRLSDTLGLGTKRARVAIEACREAWSVHDQLRSWGHDVLLVDTTRTRQIGLRQHGRKTDRIDAEVLARAVDAGACAGRSLAGHTWCTFAPSQSRHHDAASRRLLRRDWAGASPPFAQHHRNLRQARLRRTPRHRTAVAGVSSPRVLIPPKKNVQVEFGTP